MPITPLHLGILAPLNHFFPKKVNNLSFLLITLWMDASAIAYYGLGLEMGEFHGPSSHSLNAVLIMSSIVIALGMFFVSKEPKVLAWMLGAYLGGFSHILLDGMVHSEMLPFHPAPGNPFYWGGMEWVSLMLLPLLIWLISQFSLNVVQAFQRIRVARREQNR